MRRISLVSLTAVAALALTSCTPGTEAGPVIGCEGAIIGDSIPQGSDPGLSLISDGFNAEAAKLGAEVLTADANLDVNKQLSDIDGFIQRKVNAVTVWPMDGTAVRPALQRAEESGIAVVTQQTPAGIDSAINMQFDDRGAGAALATYLADKLGKGAKVAAIIGPQEVDSFRNLAEGFAEGAAKEGLEVVETQQNAELSPQKAAEITEQLKARYGSELAGIFDTINVTALAAATVVDGDFQPLIVTYEGNEETRTAILDGRIAATVYVANVLVGRAKTWTVCEQLAGTELPPNIEIPYLIADKSNIKSVPSDDDQLASELTFELDESTSTPRMVYQGIEMPESAVVIAE